MYLLNGVPFSIKFLFYSILCMNLSFSMFAQILLLIAPIKSSGQFLTIIAAVNTTQCFRLKCGTVRMALEKR